MTNNYKIARFATLLLVFFAFLTQSAKAQLEPFAQASGLISGTNGWVTHVVSPALAVPQISIVAGSLAYAGLATPTGNKITTVAGNAEDINRGLTAAITTTGYYSAILNVPNTTGMNPAGDYFMHFGGATGATMTGFMARLFVKPGTAPSTFNIGIMNNSTGGVQSFVATDFPVGTPIFVVVKYDRTLTAGGTASLFVNPTPGAVEPTANLVNATGTGAPAASLLSICIRQGGTVASGTGNVEIDELRGGTDWASVTPASATLAPTIAITQASTAIPTANTPAFAMGSVATSTDLDVTFTITNAGTAPLTLTPATITGTGYSILTPPTSPVNNVAPNNTTTFVVRFNSATAVAGALGTVTIGNNANTSYVVNLSATATAATAPIIVVTRGAGIPVPNLSSVNLGSTPINTNLDITFTITNTGNAPLVMNVPLFVASVGSVYSIITQPAATIPNGAGNTSTITVRLNSPTVNSLTLGSLSLSNNSGGSTGGFFIDLSADVTAVASPNIAVTQAATAVPSNNIFNPFVMGTTPTNTNLDVTFTVTNTGAAALGITTPLTVSGAGYSVLTQPATSVSNVLPSNTTTFVVRFNSATAIANAAGIVTIINTTGTNYVINLATNATLAGTPSIAITQGATAITTNNSPAFVMGSIVAGSNLDATFTITNAGTAPLTITTPIGITGTGYSILTQPTSPVVNGAGNTTTFVVRFNSATAVAGALGTVTIGNNANTSYVVNLSATATAVPVGGTDYEPFLQASGFVSTTNGWVAHGGTGTSPTFTQQTSISASTLLYTGLSTPAGNKATIVAGNTEDINKVLSAPLTTDAYYSALLNVSNTTGLAVNTANGDYFLALGGSSGSATISILTGRFFIRQGSTAGTFNLGVLNNSGGTAPNPIPTYSTTDYATSTTYFIVVKYNLATNTASLWINPATGLATEPTTTLNSSAGTNTAPPNLVSIVIRQGGSLTAVPPSTTGNVEIDEIRVGATWASVTPGVSVVPTLTAIPSSLAFGSVLIATNSTSQSYTLTGANLTSPVTVTAPAEFAISATAGGTYGATLTFTVAQMATPQTIFVRASPLTVGAKTGNITHASTGVATLPTVALTATGTSVAPVPSLTVAPASIAFGNVIVTAPVATNSTSISYVLTGTNLTNPVTITAPAEFTISDAIAGTYGATLTFTVAQMATPKTIFVRVSPLTIGAKTGNITHTSTGVTTLPTVALTATGIIPTLTVAPATLALGDVVVNTNSVPKSYVLTGVSIINPVTVTAPAEFTLATSATSAVYSPTLTFTVAEMATARTIFVRASPTTVGAKAANITHTSTGVAALPTVALTATSVLDNITAGPNLDFGTASTRSFSAVKTFSVQGTSLTADLVVTAPTNFQVSKDGITFAATANFTAAEVAPIAGKNVSVRFAPVSGVSGLKSAVITVTSAGSLAKNVNVTGTETSPATALDNSFAKEVVIYPNPAQTTFQIKLPTNSKNYTVELVDVTGKVILTKKSDEIISVENLQKGFYFVKFSNAERTFTKKISIN